MRGFLPSLRTEGSSPAVFFFRFAQLTFLPLFKLSFSPCFWASEKGVTWSQTLLAYLRCLFSIFLDGVRARRGDGPRFPPPLHPRTYRTPCNHLPPAFSAGVLSVRVGFWPSSSALRLFGCALSIDGAPGPPASLSWPSKRSRERITDVYVKTSDSFKIWVWTSFLLLDVDWNLQSPYWAELVEGFHNSPVFMSLLRHNPVDPSTFSCTPLDPIPSGGS